MELDGVNGVFADKLGKHPRSKMEGTNVPAKVTAKLRQMLKRIQVM